MRLALETTMERNGRYVAFRSEASNLVAGDTNGAPDVFVRDLERGTTELVSMAAGGAQSNDYSQSPMLSADGRYVAFTSRSTNLVPNDTNGTYDVFVRDRIMGTTQRVSVASSATQADRGGFGPSISTDGRYVTFHSDASNLDPADGDTVSDVFIRGELGMGVPN